MIRLYDAFGGETITAYDSEGVVTSIRSTTFDERGNYLGSVSASDDSGIAQNEIKMAYNDDDLLISKRYFSDGEENFSETYRYDDSGELLSRVAENSQGDLTSTTYQYTKTKSWKALFARFYREWKKD